MPTVLTAASQVTCTHGGTIVTTGVPKLKIDGSLVVLEAGVVGKPVSPGAPLPPPPPPATPCSIPTDPNTGTKSCTSVVSVSTGKSAKLTVNGQPVLLESLGGATDGTGPSPAVPPTNALMASANQTKLTAI